LGLKDKILREEFTKSPRLKKGTWWKKRGGRNEWTRENSNHSVTYKAWFQGRKNSLNIALSENASIPEKRRIKNKE